MTRDEQSTDLLACTGSSVAVHGGEQGVCCGNADLCSCDAYTCKSDATLGFCQCGPTGTLSASLTGAGMASCPADATQKCCLLADTHACSCSASDCESGAMMVASCTVAMVAVCDAPKVTATTCK